MGSPRTNQAKVASYRCDEKIQALGRWVFLDQLYLRILEVSPYPQDAHTFFCL